AMTLLAPRPIDVLEMGPIIPYGRFRWMELEPLPAAGRRIRVWLPGHRGGHFHAIGHSLLKQASRLGLRSHRGVVLAGCLDPLDDFRVRRHGSALDASNTQNCL